VIAAIVGSDSNALCFGVWIIDHAVCDGERRNAAPFPRAPASDDKFAGGGDAARPLRSSRLE